MIERIRLTLDPDVAQIERARRALALLADCHRIGPTRLAHLQIVLDELLSNIVRHGATGAAYSVALSADERRFTLDLVDDGPPFDPTVPVYPEPGRRPRHGGRGLDMVRQLSDELSYRRANGRNELTVIKDLTAEESLMTQGLTISEEREGSTAIVALEGRIDSGNAGALTRHLTELTGEGYRTIVVDFSRLDYLTSAGFRTLLVASDAAEDQGGRLRLRALSQDVRELFELSGLLGAFEVEQAPAA